MTTPIRRALEAGAADAEHVSLTLLLSAGAMLTIGALLNTRSGAACLGP